MVGPEYPAWKGFYDLGNYTPYSYNVTLAKQYLAKAGISNFPTLNFNTLSGCPFCLTISEVVQADLAQIGINVNINVMSVSTQQAPYGSYSTEVQNANQIGQLALLGTGDWAPATLTPADYWVSFVSNQSLIGNYAIYSNPVVQQAVNAFTSSSNISYIQSLVRQAQAQVYNDAPYAWFGVNTLWDASGSLVWDNSVVSGFYVDPVWGGQNTGPLFNTVTFV
jgi:glutathione transport system substrate-binding protein